MNSNINMYCEKINNKYKIICYLDDIKQDSHIFAKLLKMDNDIFSMAMISQFYCIFEGNDFYFGNADSCEDAIKWITLNIDVIKFASNYYIALSCLYEELLSDYQTDSHNGYYYYIFLVHKKNCIVVDEDISYILGLTVSEYHNYLMDNSCCKTINNQMFFHTADDCKKVIDLLADNFEQFLLVKKILNIKGI